MGIKGAYVSPSQQQASKPFEIFTELIGSLSQVFSISYHLASLSHRRCWSWIDGGFDLKLGVGGKGDQESSPANPILEGERKRVPDKLYNFNSSLSFSM